MARINWAVVRFYPRHAAQWSNRRRHTFFNDDDYRNHVKLLPEFRPKAGTPAWTYCLTPTLCTL